MKICMYDSQIYIMLVPLFHPSSNQVYVKMTVKGYSFAIWHFLGMFPINRYLLWAYTCPLNVSVCLLSLQLGSATISKLSGL